MNSWTTILLANTHFWREDFIHNTIESINNTGNEDAVVLVEGVNLFGEKIYAYVKLPKQMYHEIKRKLGTKDKFDLREYGEVIAAGLEGSENSYKDHSELRRTYNMLPFTKK